MVKNEVKIFKALAYEKQLRIVEFLKDGKKCVCEIIPMMVNPNLLFRNI